MGSDMELDQAMENDRDCEQGRGRGSGQDTRGEFPVNWIASDPVMSHEYHKYHIKRNEAGGGGSFMDVNLLTAPATPVLVPVVKAPTTPVLVPVVAPATGPSPEMAYQLLVEIPPPYRFALGRITNWLKPKPTPVVITIAIPWP